MNFQSIAGFAILGSLLAGWQQIKGFIIKIFSVLIRTDLIWVEDEARLTFQQILKDGKIVRWGNRRWVIGGDTFIKKHSVGSHFLFLKEETVFVLYKKYIPLVLKKKDFGMSVTFLYKTFDLESLLGNSYQEVINRKKESDKQDSHFYYREESGSDVRFRSESVGYPASKSNSNGIEPNSSPNQEKSSYQFPYFWFKDRAKYIDVTYEDIDGDYGIKPKNNYYWSPEALKLEKEVQFWASNKKWFTDRNIAHKRGALLFGPGGTGKSKMVYEVAMKTNTPLAKLNISNMSDKEFESAYESFGEPRRIILIEDIDVAFRGRENVLAKNSNVKNLLSFDTLINIISGTKQTDGVFAIITSNNISVLDPVLIRPGRLDIKIEIGALDKIGREFIAKNILSDWPELIPEFVDKYDGATVAEYENHCIKKALELFYAKKE